MRANSIFFAVFWIQKALRMLVLKTHSSPQIYIFCCFPSIRNCFQEFNGLVIFSKYCRKAKIKKRGTRSIDLIKNQNYQYPNLFFFLSFSFFLGGGGGGGNTAITFALLTQRVFLGKNCLFLFKNFVYL